MRAGQRARLLGVRDGARAGRWCSAAQEGAALADVGGVGRALDAVSAVPADGDAVARAAFDLSRSAIGGQAIGLYRLGHGGFLGAAAVERSIGHLRLTTFVPRARIVTGSAATSCADSKNVSMRGGAG